MNQLLIFLFLFHSWISAHREFCPCILEQHHQHEAVPLNHKNSASRLYRVSPIIRPTRKIRPSVIFEDDFNVSPTLKISPSWERQKDERYYLWQVMASGRKIYMIYMLMACTGMYMYTYILIYMLMASKCRSFFVISVYLKSRNFYFVTSFFDISK